MTQEFFFCWKFNWRTVKRRQLILQFTAVTRQKQNRSCHKTKSEACEMLRPVTALDRLKLGSQWLGTSLIYLFIAVAWQKREKILDGLYLFCLFFVPTVIQLSRKGSNLSAKFSLNFFRTKRQVELSRYIFFFCFFCFFFVLSLHLVYDLMNYIWANCSWGKSRSGFSFALILNSWERKRRRGKWLSFKCSLVVNS